MVAFFRRFAMPVAFLVVLAAVSAIYAYALGPAGQRSLVSWTATNLANLRTDPLGTLIASAFVAEEGPWTWLPFAALGLCALTYRFGNLRTLLLVGAAHVIGTLVSEGILAWRIAAGAEPSSLRHLDDVGPSYVIASALLATILYGANRWWRLGGVVCLALLSPYMFIGLGHLAVAAVGHVVALATGALVGLPLHRSVASDRARSTPDVAAR